MVSLTPEMQLLSSLSVQDVLDDKADPHMRHTVADTDTIQTALKLMQAKDVLSLPVYHQQDTAGKRHYIDLVTIEDLRDYIISWPELKDEIEYQELYGRARGSTVLSTPLANVINRPHQRPATIAPDAPLQDLLRLFSESHRHRVLIRSPENSTADSPPIGLTQTDVLRVLNHNNHKLGAAFNALAVDVVEHSAAETAPGADGCNSRALATVPIRDTALAAFERLRGLRLGALGVIDAEGALVTELAGTSLRWLTDDNLRLLGKPVVAYLFGLRRNVTAPYVCRPNFTVSQLMTGLMKTRARRAWVVDRMNQPTGVITMTDIIKLFRDLPTQRRPPAQHPL